MNRVLSGLCYGSAAGSILGAISHDQVVAWTGALIAVGSALVTAGLPVYHRLREARRSEDAADRARVLEDVRALTRVQVEMEGRIAADGRRLNEIEAQMERIRCRYPNSDGTAHCADPANAPVKL